MKIVQFTEHPSGKIQYIVCDNGVVYERTWSYSGMWSSWIEYITPENMVIIKKY